jgi:hypothetical protein
VRIGSAYMYFQKCAVKRGCVQITVDSCVEGRVGFHVGNLGANAPLNPPSLSFFSTFWQHRRCKRGEAKHILCMYNSFLSLDCWINRPLDRCLVKAPHTQKFGTIHFEPVAHFESSFRTSGILCTLLFDVIH